MSTRLVDVILETPHRDQIVLGDTLSDRTVFVLVRYFG
jgi:hypothetical protein